MKAKHIVFMSLLVGITVIVATPVLAQWSNTESKDEMTGDHSCYAMSAMVGPTEPMDFPYKDVKAWMGVGSDGEWEWIFLGFSEAPNLTDDVTEDGFNRIDTRIKWDDTVETVTLTQQWGAKFLRFRNVKGLLPKIEASSSVLLELNWYGQGRVYFRFSLSGSTAAIDKMRGCAGS